MSSPSHRRQRSSQSGTPKRSSRKSSQPVATSPSMDPSAAQLLGEAASSQAGSQGTPRNVPLSSSPMFFRSSPANGASTGRNVDISSPLRRQVTNDLAMTDGGDRTPRPSGQLIGGMFIATSVQYLILMPCRFLANSLRFEFKSCSRAHRPSANRPP
jgi:DNA replication licensing factor MCM4